MASSSTSSTAKLADHLCVLLHGLWGNPQHLNYLSTSLQGKYDEDQLHVLVAERNANSFTYDGIEVCGERVTQEIEEKLEELARTGQKIRKLSIVGYSLGGLVARYAIGLLYSKGWFEKLEPVNFTTFATPHLGVRSPLLGYFNHIWNVLGARTLSMSGRQLFTIDSFRDTGRPLLSVLADPDSIFICALKRFKSRSLYANVVNDRSAPYYTTGISRVDPFVDPDKLNIHYLEGYEPVILDDEKAVSREEEELPSFSTRFTGSKNAFSRLPTILFPVILIPIVVVLYLLNSAVQTTRSRQRIRLHEEGKAGIGIGLYRIPLMVDDVRRTAEDVFENINNAQSQEYLPAGSEEMASPNSAPSSLKQVRGALAEKGSTLSGVISEADDSSVTDQKLAAERQLGFPTLALTAYQFAMIKALDEVGWKKHLVYIHDDDHSHAAIIVRRPKKSFEEGKIVVKHWLNQFEI